MPIFDKSFLSSVPGPAGTGNTGTILEGFFSLLNVEATGQVEYGSVGADFLLTRRSQWMHSHQSPSMSLH